MALFEYVQSIHNYENVFDLDICSLLYGKWDLYSEGKRSKRAIQQEATKA
jgi:hypothetical protein